MGRTRTVAAPVTTEIDEVKGSRFIAAAAEGLATAPVTERPVVRTFDLTFDYGLSGAVEGVLAAFDARTVGSAYAAAVDLRVTVAEEHAEAFAAEMAEATSGRVEPQPVSV